MKLIYLKSNFVLEPKTIKTYISIKKKVKKNMERERERLSESNCVSKQIEIRKSKRKKDSN
jgi:hypothetical protein